MALYRLMVRADDLPYWKESSFGAFRAMTWSALLVACRDAMESPGAAQRRYRAEEVRDAAFVVEGLWSVRAGERVGSAEIGGRR